MSDPSEGSEARVGSSRHTLVVRDSFYRPLPVKSEPVVAYCQVEKPEFQNVGSPDLIVERPTIIDESERLFSAGELYAAALADVEIEPTSKPKRRVGASNVQRIELWGAGTSGLPRRGSRTIRLFKAQPDEIFNALKDQPFGLGLQLDERTFEFRAILDEPELHVEGKLEGAYALRSGDVEVSLRATRFNAMFTAVEVRLTARRHPRRFFRAAHDAIQSLPLPGRT